MFISRRSAFLSSFCCLLLVGLAGCAFSPVNRPRAAENSGIREKVLKYPPQRAFNLAALTAQSMGYRFFKADRNSLAIITMPKALPAGGNADCGTWNGRPISGSTDGCLFLEVAGLGQGESRVRVQARYVATFRGRNIYGMVTTQETFRCASLGDLEEDFLARLKRMAAVTKPEAVDQAADEIREEGVMPQPPAKPEVAKEPGTPGSLTEQTPHTGPEHGLALKYHIMYLMGVITQEQYKALKGNLRD